MTATQPRTRAAAPLLATPAAVQAFTHILTRGPIARIDVTRQTGLSQAAVTKAVSPLISAGFVSADGGPQHTAQPGRPVNPLRVVGEALAFLGLKVNADEVIGVVTDLHARILHATRVPVANTDADEIVRALIAAASTLVSRCGGVADRIAGVGVSVSGDVDETSGVVRHSPLLGWRDVPLVAMLRPSMPARVHIDNDVRALTIAEQWFGVGVGVESFAIVTIGAGIGCGLYLNGDVVEGGFGVAGEIGHLPFGLESAVCRCGRHGCVETVASSRAILDAVRTSTGNPGLTMFQAGALAHSGHAGAVAAFERAGSSIGMALAAMVNLVGPKVVLLAGEGVADYDLYESRVREVFSEHVFGAAAQCRIVTQSHTFDDWARGAAASSIRATVRGGLVLGA